MRLLKRMAANFISLNDEFAINGVPMTISIAGQFRSLEDYTTNVVLKDDMSAHTLVHSILSLILRMSIVHVILDPTDSTIVYTRIQPIS